MLLLSIMNDRSFSCPANSDLLMYSGCVQSVVKGKGIDKGIAEASRSYSANKTNWRFTCRQQQLRQQWQRAQ